MPKLRYTQAADGEIGSVTDVVVRRPEPGLECLDERLTVGYRVAPARDARERGEAERVGREKNVDEAKTEPIAALLVDEGVGYVVALLRIERVPPQRWAEGDSQ